MGMLVCPKPLANYYQSTRHDIPEEWKSHFLFFIVITLEHMQHINYSHLKYFLLMITCCLHSNVWVDLALLFMFHISVQWSWEMSLHSIWTVMWQRSVNIISKSSVKSCHPADAGGKPTRHNMMALPMQNVYQYVRLSKLLSNLNILSDRSLVVPFESVLYF